jgi:hypothetical protein
MNQQLDTVERNRLIAESIGSCQAFAAERIDRYLQVQHQGVPACREASRSEMPTAGSPEAGRYLRVRLKSDTTSESG